KAPDERFEHRFADARGKRPGRRRARRSLERRLADRQGAEPREPAAFAAELQMRGAVASRGEPALGPRTGLQREHRIARAVGEPLALPGGERSVDALGERAVVALAQ